MGAQKRKARHGGKRAGAGRPRLFRDPVRVALDLERSEVKTLTKIAEKQDRSLASVIREAVGAFLKRRRR